jgi:hypothetical protein
MHCGDFQDPYVNSGFKISNFLLQFLSSQRQLRSRTYILLFLLLLSYVFVSRRSYRKIMSCRRRIIISPLKPKFV